MIDWKHRTELLIGDEALEALSKKHVIVFGLGGVGGILCEALVRAGVGALDMVDPDIIEATNKNRQIIALDSTIGKVKVDVLRKRLLDINPKLQGRNYRLKYQQQTSDHFDFFKYDFVVDCIDEVYSKVSLAKEAEKAGVPFIASMGTGFKLNPCKLQIDNLSNTTTCPLARKIRRLVRKEGIKDFPVVYSSEKPIINTERKGEGTASISTVPPVAGLMMASYILNQWVYERNEVI